MWNDKAYDNWKLASPYDDEPNIEVFKAEKYEVYTTNEDDIYKFEEVMESVQYHVIQPEYDSRDEYLEECMYNLIDDLSLHGDDIGAMEAFVEHDYGLFLDAVENGYKGKYKRGY
tara:strand:- start:1425 stop:1769 length:345 start_codon:yes stop_codon:yes gene_type:complete